METDRNDRCLPSLFVRRDLWGILQVKDFKQSVKKDFDYDVGLMQEFIFLFFGYGTMSFERMWVYRILFLQNFPNVDPNVFWIPAIDFCKDRGPSAALRSLKRAEDVTDIFETLYMIDRHRLLNDCLESREVFDTFAEAIASSKLVSRQFLKTLVKANQLPRIPLLKCIQNFSNSSDLSLGSFSHNQAHNVTIAYERGSNPRVYLIGEYGECTRQLDMSTLRSVQLVAGEQDLNIHHAVGIGKFLYVLSEKRMLYVYDPKKMDATKLYNFVVPVRGICRCNNSLLVLDDAGNLTMALDPLCCESFIRLNRDSISLASFSQVFLDYSEKRIMIAQVFETESCIDDDDNDDNNDDDDDEADIEKIESKCLFHKRVIYSEIFALCTKDDTECFEIVNQNRIEHDIDDGFKISSIGFFQDGEVFLICGNGNDFRLSFIYENDEAPIDDDIVCFNQDGTILWKNGDIESKNRIIAFIPELEISQNIALTSLQLLSYECFQK